MKNLTIGEFLKSYREKLNLNISDVHRKTGVSQPYLSQIEAGKIPSRKTIIKIANGLGENKFQVAELEANLLDLAGFSNTANEEISLYEFVRGIQNEQNRDLDEKEAVLIYKEDILSETKIRIDFDSKLELFNLENIITSKFQTVTKVEGGPTLSGEVEFHYKNKKLDNEDRIKIIKMLDLLLDVE